MLAILKYYTWGSVVCVGGYLAITLCKHAIGSQWQPPTWQYVPPLLGTYLHVHTHTNSLCVVDRDQLFYSSLRWLRELSS